MPQRSPYDPIEYGQPIKIYDTKKGLWTVDPSLVIPREATPYCANVWVDEEGALTKMPGTELLVTETNNAFCAGECWQLFVYKNTAGQRKLIFQGLDISDASTMKLWYLEPQDSYPASTAMTDFTPVSELNKTRKCSFVNYKGKLYLANGADNLKSWDGCNWLEHHESENEHYTYLTVYDACLIGLHSPAHPTRIVFSAQHRPVRGVGGELNSDDFTDYYLDDIRWREIPMPKGDYITGGVPSPWGSLLVFGRNSITDIHGSLYNDSDVRYVVSVEKGTVDGYSVQVLGDSVFFVWEDGIYAIGGVGIRMDEEDQKLKVSAKVNPITANVRNWWEENVTLPEPGEYGQLIWSGYQSFCQTITFDTGTTEIEVGDEIFIGTDRMTVKYVDVDSGTWAGGDAAGTLYVTRMIPCSASFSDDENILIGTTQAAVVNGSSQPGGEVETVSGLELNVDGVTDYPDIVNFQPIYNPTNPNLGGAICYIREVEGQTTQDSWCDLRSNLGEDQFFSEFAIGGTENFGPNLGAYAGVFLYLKEVGDCSGVTLKTYLTRAVGAGQKLRHPNFSEVYAQGTLDGSFLNDIFVLGFTDGTSEMYIGETITGGTSGKSGTIKMVVVTSGSWLTNDAAGYLYLSGTLATNDFTDDEALNIGAVQHATADGQGRDIDDGAFIFVPFTYFPFGQTAIQLHPQCNIAVKVTDDTDSNYLQWGHSDTDLLNNCRIVNSDSTTPADQSTKDYTFRLATKWWDGNPGRCYIITTPKQAGASLETWTSVNIELDEKTLGNFEKSSIIEAVYYEVRPENDGWGSWTKTTNGGAISGTNRWVRLKIVCSRPNYDSDTIAIKNITASYKTQAVVTQLVTSAIWENRYWFSTTISYPEYGATPS